MGASTRQSDIAVARALEVRLSGASVLLVMEHDDGRTAATLTPAEADKTAGRLRKAANDQRSAESRR